MDNIFSTSVLYGLLAFMFERNWHYFMVGVTMLAIFGLYYHITHHDEHTGNTFKLVHGYDWSYISILIARFFLASVFLVMGGLHGLFNFVPTGTVETAPAAEAFVRGLIGTGYLLPAVKTIELVVGITFLFGIWMPLTLVVAAPIVLNMIANAPAEDQKALKNKVYVMTAGAPPPSSILQKMESLGFEVMHVYGLTETYGHVVHCAWNKDWNSLAEDKRSELKAYQGVRYPHTEMVSVMNPDTLEPVPSDGETMGEIMIRGNTVMMGYYKNEKASQESMKSGWFHSGDLAVMHPSGYIQVKDRSKDIIISGGENISSVEIENIITRHPAVSLAAVVARPDEKWGETPCAFIELADGQTVEEDELKKFCREHLAGFKMPKTFVFQVLPKTSTGKIQKYELRETVKKL